jgi:hypothetical protein
MKYFLLADLGYDGIGMLKYSTKEAAIARFQEDKKYREENEWTDQPLIIIEGNVIENYKWELER